MALQVSTMPLSKLDQKKAKKSTSVKISNDEKVLVSFKCRGAVIDNWRTTEFKSTT